MDIFESNARSMECAELRERIDSLEKQVHLLTRVLRIEIYNFITKTNNVDVKELSKLEEIKD